MPEQEPSRGLPRTPPLGRSKPEAPRGVADLSLRMWRACPGPGGAGTGGGPRLPGHSREAVSLSLHTNVQPAGPCRRRARKLSSSRCNEHALDPAVLLLAHHPVKTFSGLNVELKQIPLPDELSLAEPARVSPGFKGSGGKSDSKKKENSEEGDQPGERSSQGPVNSGNTARRLD